MAYGGPGVQSFMFSKVLNEFLVWAHKIILGGTQLKIFIIIVTYVYNMH